MTKNVPIETIDGCLSTCMSILGNKWTALLLRDMAMGPQRFSDLQRSIATINPRTLSKRLNDLEARGIIQKQPHEDSARSVYALTPKGAELIPALRQMAAWGAKYSAE